MTEYWSKAYVPHRYLGRVAHAEIESEPGQKNAREVPLPQTSGKTGRRFAGKMSEHADELQPGPTRRPQHRGGRQDSAGLRALRLLHRDLPDLRAFGDELDSPRGRIYLIKEMLEH